MSGARFDVNRLRGEMLADPHRLSRQSATATIKKRRTWGQSISAHACLEQARNTSPVHVYQCNVAPSVLRRHRPARNAVVSRSSGNFPFDGARSKDYQRSE